MAQMCLVWRLEWGRPGEGEGPPVGDKHMDGGEPMEDVGECMPGECICGGPGGKKQNELILNFMGRVKVKYIINHTRNNCVAAG